MGARVVIQPQHARRDNDIPTEILNELYLKNRAFAQMAYEKNVLNGSFYL